MSSLHVWAQSAQRTTCFIFFSLNYVSILLLSQKMWRHLLRPWTWISFLVFFLKGISFGPSRATLWTKPGCSGRDGYRGCFRPPTHVDTARVILAGGLRNPGFLCICGTKGSHVAYGKPLHLRLPHLLQVGWCELSRWDLLHHSWTHPGCWGSHKHCMCLW